MLEGKKPVDLSISPLRENTLSKERRAGISTGQDSSFQKILTGLIDKVSQLEKDADESIKQLITGKVENIHQVMIAVEEASVAFQLMMEIRNKLVEAYKEIMRMQM